MEINRFLIFKTISFINKEYIVLYTKLLNTIKMKRRTFLKLSGLTALELALGIFSAGCDNRDNRNPQNPVQEKKLSDFPYFLANQNNEFDGYAIVGDTAPGSDVVAAVDVMTGIQNAGIAVPNPIRLASEVSSLDKHAILFGRNSTYAPGETNPFLDYEQIPVLTSGEGYIGLEEQNGLYRIIVSGFEALDVRKAGRVLSEHCTDPNKYNLDGRKILVQGTTLTDLTTQILE